jgi:AAA15 family ATPase/GTPase
MKVKSINLKYFKRFRDSKFDFTEPETGFAKNLIVLVGMNGSGKSTILQAIAATLGDATGRLKNASELNWPGLNWELTSKNWPLPSEIEIDVEFSKNERKATQEFYQKCVEIGIDLEYPPSNFPQVLLSLKGEKVKGKTASELFQFKGREYARQIKSYHPEGFDVFKCVGTVFWYAEQRTSTSFTAEEAGKSIQFDEELLRRRLDNFQRFHENLIKGNYPGLKPGQKDLFEELEKSYKSIFPERSFLGSLPPENIDDVMNEFLFYLYDGIRHYEISEMSGGERAIFPILFDFANWNIHNSVILIDEIELHLHPPLQQAIIRAMMRNELGTNNQFIITTHSDSVVQILDDESVIRVGD